MTEGLSTLIAPAVEPVTLAEAKLHLRVDIDLDDELITSLIKAAREKVETDARRALVSRSLLLTLDSFPGDCSSIVLPMPPLASVVSITYVDSEGESQELSSDKYVVDTTAANGRIALASGESWPDVYGEIGVVNISYIAGYGDASNVPDCYKVAIKLLLGHWYEHREAAADRSVSTVPLAYESIILSARNGRYV